MGGRDQSQVKIKFKKFEKVKSVPIDVPKSHNDDSGCVSRYKCVPACLIVIVNILLCCLPSTTFAIFSQGPLGGNISNLLPELLLYTLECSIL